jgi:uncharacterized protein YjbI with pentapeptide repeats
LSNWIIAAGALVVLAVAVVIWFVLLRRYGGQGATVQLDAIRTAGTLVIGTGGAVALLLTARRQRYTELTLVHTDRDAIERRITELYTKAADQLGSEQAPVRLAGLYALERLAHSTVEHRQTMVDVICAYLRMPYPPPPPAGGRSYRSLGPTQQRRARTRAYGTLAATPTSRGSRQVHAEQERQVRLTAQNILLRNLRVIPQRRRWWQRTPPSAVPAWPGIRLDLTEALLLDFSLSECQLDHADFALADFTGEADFTNAQFVDGADFSSTRFSNWANFDLARFTGRADFSSARFARRADFNSARFTGRADFGHAQFTGRADFGHAQFTDGAVFGHARFTGRSVFGHARFTGRADFSSARFARRADFGHAQFTGRSVFRGARFTDGTDFGGARFTDGTDFGGARFTGRADFSDAQFTDGVNLRGASYTPGAGFEIARVGSVELGTVWPPGWCTRSAQPENRIGPLELREDPAFLYLARVEEPWDA